MAEFDARRFEIDRLTNMLRAFGWQVTETKLQDDRVEVKIEKTVKPEVPEVKPLT